MISGQKSYKWMYFSLLQINCFTQHKKGETISKGVQLSRSLLNKRHYSRVTCYIQQNTPGSARGGEDIVYLKALNCFRIKVWIPYPLSQGSLLDVFCPRQGNVLVDDPFINLHAVGLIVLPPRLGSKLGLHGES